MTNLMIWRVSLPRSSKAKVFLASKGLIQEEVFSTDMNSKIVEDEF